MAEPPNSTGPSGDGLGETRLPNEIAALLDAAIKRSLDKAIQASGVHLPPPKESEIVQRVSREVTIAFQHEISSSYHGPLPPPEMLSEFERVVPGLGGQIVQMAMKEQSHRHLWERRALLNDMFMQSGALTLGWALAGGALVGAFFLGMADHPVPMGILLSVSVLQMVRTIIGGGQQKKEDSSPVPKAPATALKSRDKKKR